MTVQVRKGLSPSHMEQPNTLRTSAAHTNGIAAVSGDDEITAEILYLFEGNIATGYWIFFTFFIQHNGNNSLFCLRDCLNMKEICKKERNGAKENETSALDVS